MSKSPKSAHNRYLFDNDEIAFCSFCLPLWQKGVSAYPCTRHIAWKMPKKYKKIVQRKLEAITKVTIPKTICTIQYILSNLEKKEREDFFQRNGINKYMNPKELIKEIVLTLLIDHNKPLCDERKLPPFKNNLSISSSNVSSLIKFDIAPLDMIEVPLKNNKNPQTPRLLSDKAIQLSFGDVKLTENDDNLSSIKEYKPDVIIEPIKKIIGERDVIVLVSKERGEAPIKKFKYIISNKEMQPPKQREQSIIEYDEKVQQADDPPKETKLPTKTLTTEAVQDSPPEENHISREQHSSKQNKQQLSVFDSQNKPSSSKDYQCNKQSSKKSIKDMNNDEKEAKNTGKTDENIGRISKSSKPESLGSKVPSKVSSAVRKLWKLIPNSPSKKTELIVIKHSEDSDNYSDEFIPPKAVKGYIKRKEIAEIIELSAEVDNLCDKTNHQGEQNGEIFETGEWFEIPETIPKIVEQTKNSGTPSLCESLEKQNSESHLDIPGNLSALIPTTSKLFSDNFLKALNQIKSCPGQTLSTELLIDRISIDYIEDQKALYEYDDKLKKRFLDLITNKNSDVDTEIPINVTNPNVFDINGSKSTKESETCETARIKKIIHRDKKKKVLKQQEETEKPLKIFNSDEVLKKAP